MKLIQAAVFGLILSIFVGGCAQTTHEVEAAPVVVAKSAQPLSWADFESRLDEPGPIELRKFVAADWAVPREGMINLEHPQAKAAHLSDGPEAIQVYFYEIEHAEHGGFLIDSGVARSVAHQTDEMPLRFPVTVAMPFDALKVRLDTRAYMESRSTALNGVFLTHLHLDHILGLQDIPKNVPLYVGPGEHEDARATHVLVRPSTDLNLEGFGPLLQWQVHRAEGEPFAWVDIFGDGSLVGLHIPGHTQGNMAFVVRSTEGVQLIAGDGSHTAWGWEHGVEPGTFNTSGEEAADSLARLREFSAAHPAMRVHLGHQELH